MNNPLNLDVARKAAAPEPDCPWTFVSDIDDYGLAAHRLMAMDYLRKPATPEGVERRIWLIETVFGRERQRKNAFQEPHIQLLTDERSNTTNEQRRIGS